MAGRVISESDYRLLQEMVTWYQRNKNNFPQFRRRNISVSQGLGSQVKIFEVQSEATGDGVYNCYEQILDATEWDDTAGDPKFDNANTTSVEVLNLAEYNPESTYVAHLAAGDLIAAWQKMDDENNKRWVGVPFPQPNYADYKRTFKVFRVTAVAAGDGLYTCNEQKLDATDWADTTGVNKFLDSGLTGVTVLCIAEYDAESGYVAYLTVGDLILARRMDDDEDNERWVGTPLRQGAHGAGLRNAYCKNDAGAGSTIVCYLDVDVTGTEITVNCSISNGNNLNQAGRRLKDGNRLAVYKVGGNWYAAEGFDTDEECVCTAPP